MKPFPRFFYLMDVKQKHPDENKRGNLYEGKEGYRVIQLVKKAMNSDTDAFLTLMDQNANAMYKVARGILKNDADVADAVQDTILTCFEKLHTLKKPEYFKTWMTRILINECNRILAYYRNLNMPEQFPDIGRNDMSLAEFEFREMLGAVDEKYRIILVLYYVEGFRVQEIARILDMKENTVKTRLSRAREQIREIYKDTDSFGKTKQNKAGIDQRQHIKRQGEDLNEKANRFQFG